MKQAIKYLLALLILFLIASIPLAMQLETGSIRGRITTEVGSVANASVELRNVATDATSRTESDVAGDYMLDRLRVGRYSLWVSVNGQEPVLIREITIERGRMIREDIRLASTPPTS